MPVSDAGATDARPRSSRLLAVAVVQQPRGDGFVSLRASAADTAGNTVRETIIRAYRYH